MSLERGRLDLAIRGGCLVTAGSEGVADLGVRDGRVVQIGGELPPADREIDAEGRLVLPGGIDAHVHLTPVQLAERSLRWADDFASGTRAAAAGGVTTVGNITFPLPGEGLLAALQRTDAEVAGEALVDYLLHPVLLDPTAQTLAEIAELGRRGFPSLKLFMTLGGFDTRERSYLEALRLAGEAGLQTMIHCEDACIIGHLVERLVAAGRRDISNFPHTRPVFSEAVAVERAVAFAEAAGAPIYIVHLSSEAALRAALRGRRRGVRVSVETRPIYLTFTEERFQGPDPGLYVGNPPLRSARDRDALWQALEAGEISTCCTDHAPWTKDAKLDPAADITTTRPGMADLETLMPTLFSQGVRQGRLSLQRFVEVTSTNAARLFNLYPRKGTIAVGSDADLVIWDESLHKTVDGARMNSRAGYSLLDGSELVGWPTHTISRGEVVFENGRFPRPGGRGRLLIGAGRAASTPAVKGGA